MRIFKKSFNRNKSEGPAKPRVVFVSHEATRTGAPKIILKLLSHFAEKCDVACESILLSGGHLAKEFQANSIVDCLNLPNQDRDGIRKRVRSFAGRYQDNLPTLAVCNSMESRYITEELDAIGVPCVSLVHELPSGYDAVDYQHVYSVSKKVVFPVDFVRKAANQLTPLPDDKTIVLPQGLLTPDFGLRVCREEAQASLREELGLPPEAFVVLGCGTLDLRKGIDHFVNVARLACDAQKADRPIHFVWVGEGNRWAHSLYHYLQLDLDNTAAQDNVHFIGERSNVESYFVGADCFLMSSRVDPFPCVIHEAMAASLPVIAFEGAGGAPEAIADGAGFVLPYADYGQVVATIRLMRDQPEVSIGIRDRALERVRQKYQFSDYAEKVVDICELVAGTELRPSRPKTEPFELRLHRAA